MSSEGPGSDSSDDSSDSAEAETQQEGLGGGLFSMLKEPPLQVLGCFGAELRRGCVIRLVHIGSKGGA